MDLKPVQMAVSEKQRTTGVDKGVEKIADGIVNWHNHFAK